MNRDEFYHKLKAKFEKEVQQNLHNKEIRSVDYQTFRSTFIAKHQNFYEKACGFCEKIYAIKPDAKKKEQLQRSIDASHLHVTPEGTLSFAVFVPLAAMLLVMIAMLFVESLFLIFFFMMFSGISILLFMNLPDYFADAWRMKASNQMILAVFYIVTYMRHTSNLERAIEFASNHLQPPMSLDLQKILWDVENGKYPRVQESLESYLANWTTYNDEFIESMHIIEGSLLEENEQKRLESLDKALDIMLSQTYEKMLHYAHDLQSPITSLHMFGIILPILGLVILPLMVSFMEDIYWYHIAVIYNIGLPVAVYIMGKNILRKRPTGYGAVDIIEDVSEKKKLSPTFLASVVFAFLFLVGLTPILMHTFGVSDFGFGLDVDPAISSCGKSYCFLDYITSDTGSNAGSLVGPFGLGAAVMSLFIPFSFSMAFFIYFSMRSKNTIKIREETQRLEKEFSHALFTFGNRLNDGLPAEMAFADVANNYPNTISGNFFMLVAYNIQKLGMSIEQAINDTKYGALKTYPSSLIQSSMQVLTQSAKKGPKVASQALMNISRYLDEMHRVNERLNDLMGEVISSMKSQINYLTPIIAGIVVGITSMISSILLKLSGILSTATEGGDTGGLVVGASGMLSAFGVGIPTYYFQIIIGLYVVQIIFILTLLVNTIENGVDPVQERYLLSKNMLRGVGLYLGVGLAVMIAFNLIAESILGSLL